MIPTLIKFTVDLYAPGAVLTPTTVEWYFHRRSFHSRRTLYPNKDLRELVQVEHGVCRVKEDFCHIRAASICDEYDGPTDGPFDRILTGLSSWDPVLGTELPRIAHTALRLAPPYRDGITRAAWIELAEVFEDAEEIRFIRQVSVAGLAMFLKQEAQQ